VRAIRVDELGGPEVLRMVEVDIPTPGSGEVLVQLNAIGVNYSDIYRRRDRSAQTLPYIPGQEAAGTIRALGTGVDGFRVGQRVAYCQIFGAYAEYAVVPAARLIAIPDALDDERAAALPLAGMTAHFLVADYVDLGPETFVLIHAAAGGVGLLATQLAARRGAHVIGTVSNQAKAARVREAGARDVILYTETDFVSEVQRITDGLGAHLILDGVGKATFPGNLTAVRNRGTIVLYGWPSGPPDPIAPLDLMWRAIVLAGGTVSNATKTRADLERRSGELIAATLDGSLVPAIDCMLPLEQAAAAHRRLESRSTIGKVLLRP